MNLSYFAQAIPSMACSNLGIIKTDFFQAQMNDFFLLWKTKCKSSLAVVGITHTEFDNYFSTLGISYTEYGSDFALLGITYTEYDNP